MSSISEHQFRQMLDRYLRNQASDEERDFLDKFFESYKHDHPNSNVHDSSAREEIFREIQSRTGVSPKSRALLPVWLKVAASVALLISSLFFYQRFKIKPDDKPLAIARTIEATPRGLKSEIVLPDGSKVFLNSESSVSFPTQFAGKTREIALSGEAYFQVIHDPSKPFIVKTSKAQTEVLGTSFNVKARAGKDVEVTLVEGKVNILSEKFAAILKPGEQARINRTNQSVAIRKVHVAQFVGWKDNVLCFEQTSLADAAATLESWYDVDIIIASESLKDCVITATYSNESLENVLKSIQFLLGATVSNAKTSPITITGTGCK
jgi:transmembrane sensor